MKRFIENLEDQNMLIFENLPVFLNIIATYLFFTVIFLMVTVVAIPLTIRGIILSFERWYVKKNKAKLEAERKRNLAVSVKKALDLHAANVLSKYPSGLKFGNHDMFSDVTLYGSGLNIFLENFFYTYNAHCYTINPINGRITCDTNRRRSLGDIYLICKYYFPSCTIHDVISILLNLLDRGRLRASYCNTINKYVFHDDLDGAYIQNSKVEYGGVNSFMDIIESYKNE